MGISKQEKFSLIRRYNLGQAIIKTSDLLEKLAKGAIILFTSTMSIVIIMQVFCRYLLGFSFFWAEEVAIFSMAWLTFIGASASIRKGELIAVEFVRSNFPPGVRKGTIVAGEIIIMAFLIWIIVFGFSLSKLNIDQLSPALRIPMAFPYLAVPFGCLFILAQTLASLLLNLINFPIDFKEKAFNAKEGYK